MLRAPVPVLVTIALLAACGGDEPSARPPAAEAAPAQPTASAAAARDAHVVLIAFDALPGLMLMNDRGQLDAERYPNFAALARSSTWYRNATMVHDSTVKSIPSILDGRYPRSGQDPTLRDHPRNVFTLLRRTHRIRAHEQATRLCPRAVCRKSTRKPKVLDALRADRAARFRSALNGIGASSKPTFTFMHVLLPHEPLSYLPSGKAYQDVRRDVDATLDGPQSYDNGWLSDQAYQRHVLQLGYVDRLIGRLLERLRATGTYDRTLLIITADHGMSFTRKRTPAPPFEQGELGFRRDLRTGNAADVAIVPLFVKRPGQTQGRVDGGFARTIDIVPTIADVLNLRMYPASGRSLLRGPARPRRITVKRNRGGALRLDTAQLARRARISLQRKARLFGRGRAGVYGIGPRRELHGRAVAELTVVPKRSRLRAAVRAAQRLRNVNLAGPFLPTWVIGRLQGAPASGRRLAVAMNGRIAATCPTFRNTGGPTRANFSCLLPDAALRQGANQLELFEILPGRQVRLQRIGR